jgi:hypothetical protein
LVPLGTQHLTGENVVRWTTHPGQAHFAIPGAAHHCFECVFFESRRPDDLKAICAKAAQLLYGQRPRAIPRNAVICQYFDEAPTTSPDKR